MKTENKRGIIMLWFIGLCLVNARERSRVYRVTHYLAFQSATVDSLMLVL